MTTLGTEVAVSRTQVVRLIEAARRRGFRYWMSLPVLVGIMPAVVAVQNRAPGYADAPLIAALFVGGPALGTWLLEAFDREGRAARELVSWLQLALHMRDRLASETLSERTIGDETVAQARAVALKQWAERGELATEDWRAAAMALDGRERWDYLTEAALVEATATWRGGARFESLLATVRTALDRPGSPRRIAIATLASRYSYTAFWLAISLAGVGLFTVIIALTPECASLGDPIPGGSICH